MAVSSSYVLICGNAKNSAPTAPQVKLENRPRFRDSCWAVTHGKRGGPPRTPSKEGDSDD
jgi:hypothetical protein